MIPEITTTIEQRSFLKGYQKFEIHPNGELEVTVKRFSNHRQFKIPLWRLLPSPTRMKYNPIGSSTSVGIFGLLTAWMFIQAIASKDWNAASGFLIPLILFGILFLVCLFIFRARSIDSTVFYLRQGGQLHVWFENPNAKIFQSFCETLSKKAEEAWKNRPSDVSPQTLAGELAMLKKLKDDGALSDTQFEKAKAKLIGPSEERRIGFQ